MKKVFAIVILLVLSLSCTAFAANWVWIDSTDTYGTYVDSSSIVRIPNNGYSDGYYVCWSKMEFLSPDESGTKYSIHKFELYNKPSGKYYRIVSLTQYDENGKVIISGDSSNEPLSSIPPGTILEEIYNFVVSYK